MIKSLFFVCLLVFCLHHVTNAQNVDTVVITAKRDTTYRKTTCNFEVRITHPLISDYAEYNFTKMINGLAPGMQSINGGGQPGSSAEMLIRGMSSISDNNAPLIILDGIPYYGDLSAINSNDIDNITISKDPVATFDFGNRGGNSIVNINTKKEFKYSSKKLEIDAKFGVNTQAISDYKTLGIKDYYETLYTAMRNAGISGNVVDYLGGYNAYHLNGVRDSLQDEYLIDPTTGKLNSSAQLKYQDSWRKEMRRIGIRQSYDIASSARNNKGGYYFSSGYLNDKGYIKQTDFTKYSVRLNGDYKLLNWLKLGIKTQATTSNQDNPNQNLFKSSQLMAPVYPVYYRDGNDKKEKDPIITGMDKFDWGSLKYYAPNSSIGERRNYPGSNDIALLYLDDHSNKTSMFLLNPYVEISFLKGFTYSANVGYNFNKSNGYDYYNGNHGAYVQMGGAEGKATNTFSTLSFIHRLVWDKEINKHHLTLTVGNEYFKQKVADSSGFHYLNNPSFATITSSKNSMNNEGYFSNLTYEYDEKYLLFTGFRKDATLMAESHWVNNWAVGAGYVISEERFIKNVRFINQLKLKASYGTQGRYFPSYRQLNMPFSLQPPTSGFPPGAVIPTLGNQFNISLESNLFNNRISFEINAYNRNSGENILPLNLWPASPYSELNYNNKGIELSFYITNITRKYFTWNTVFMLTHNKNSIQSLPEGRDSFIAGNNIYKKGNSMADFYLPEYAGVDPNNGYALFYAEDMNGKETKTSDYFYAVETNRKNFGSAFPTVYGSMTNRFTYKNFDLSIQVNYSLGGKYYDQVYQDLMNNGQNANNWSTDILNHWAPDNRITDVPKLNPYDLFYNNASSRFLRNASYLNIANVYLGYTFNETKIKKAKMKSLRVYLTANNIWLFTAAKGMNPQGSFNGTPGYVYLPARSIMFGLNVGI